ncbi:hypothetical protein [Hyalangium sp.]|uniref:hypothetical protein n=1 Tax=Hyalangium sp. TaxID=2028555 RepID=UPI002D4BEBBC|nr:hypothetical protein [Hyalangium sp.]HYH98702.1 hypothetical protein [Hyalangium sp.]
MTPRPFGSYELLKRVAIGGVSELWLAERAHQAGPPHVAHVGLVLGRGEFPEGVQIQDLGTLVMYP